MSTRSYIASLDSHRAIYCHWDGYPSHMLPLLEEFYNTPEKVEELIDLGSLSYLDERVKPNKGEEHSFQKPADGVTVAYHRDRGEDWKNTSPEEWSTLTELLNSLKESWVEYLYVFADGVWFVRELD